MMKKYFQAAVAVACLLSLSIAQAQTQPDRRLPEFSLMGDAGDEVLTKLPIQQPYVLVVLDLKNPVSLDLMQMLNSSKLDGAQIYVAVLFPDGGNAGKHQQREMERIKPMLPQATWLRGNGFDVLKTLKLSGMPAVLGVDPKSLTALGQHTVVWRVMGLPTPADRLGQQVKAWISAPSAPPAAPSASDR
jgi:hypothetical protein